MTFLADDSKQVSPVLIPSPLGDEKFLGKNGFEGRYWWFDGHPCGPYFDDFTYAALTKDLNLGAQEIRDIWSHIYKSPKQQESNVSRTSRKVPLENVSRRSGNWLFWKTQRTSQVSTSFGILQWASFFIQVESWHTKCHLAPKMDISESARTIGVPDAFKPQNRITAYL